MEDEVRKKLKDFDQVFDLIDHMIKHLDEMMNKVNRQAEDLSDEKPLSGQQKERSGNAQKLKL